MNPFLTMIEVLRLLLQGQEATARLDCSPCAGESCGVCNGQGSVPLSSLRGSGPTWADEAAMIVEGCVPIGCQDPLVRAVLIPMIQASKALADEEGCKVQRRCERARLALARCAAEDWRRACLNFVDCVEKGVV